jgi:hypothetical protein
MGHLMTTPAYSELPINVRQFAYKMIENKIRIATDTVGRGCQFYILKDGLLNEWTYNYYGTTVVIDYSRLDKFNPAMMRFTT